jgi:hypothetical protein
MDERLDLIAACIACATTTYSNDSSFHFPYGPFTTACIAFSLQHNAVVYAQDCPKGERKKGGGKTGRLGQ